MRCIEWEGARQARLRVKTLPWEWGRSVLREDCVVEAARADSANFATSLRHFEEEVVKKEPPQFAEAAFFRKMAQKSYKIRAFLSRYT